MASYDDTATVSGSVVSIENGADDVPTKSLIVTIPASLSGTSEVTETQTGKNLLDTAIAETKTNNSVLITCDGKGKYTATGTATGGSANITFTLKTPCEIKSGDYFHCGNSVANGNASITLQKQDNSTIMYFSLSPTNRIVDLSSYAGETVYSIRFYVVNGASFEMILTPMICFSSTASTFEPYQTPTQYTASLGRTIYGGQADIVNGTGTDENGNDFTFDGQEINTRLGYNAFWSEQGNTELTYYKSGYGFTSVTVTRCGKNFADMSKIEQGSISSRDGGNINSTTRVRTNYIKVLGGETYSFSIGGAANIYELYQYDKNGTKLTYNAINAQTTVLTTQSDCAYIRFIMRYSDNTTIRPSDIVNLQIEKSASPTAYEPYEAVSKTAYLHKVIYAGEVDVIKGTAKPKNLLDASTGTGTGTIWYYYDNGILLEKDKSYTLSCGNRGSGSISFYGIDHTTQLAYSYIDNSSSSVTFTPTENVYVCPRIYQPGLTPETVVEPQLEVGATPSEYVPQFDPFTFPPISMSTDEGENTLFANEGASAITYRKETD